MDGIGKNPTKMRVKITKGCWLWLGPPCNQYGRVMLRKKSMTAHRMMYFLFYGWNKGSVNLVIDHICENKMCVNPKHRRLVTDRVNILRGNSVTAKNARKTKCPKGHPYDRIMSNNGRACDVCVRARDRGYNKKRKDYFKGYREKKRLLHLLRNEV